MTECVRVTAKEEEEKRDKSRLNERQTYIQCMGLINCARCSDHSAGRVRLPKYGPGQAVKDHFEDAR